MTDKTVVWLWYVCTPWEAYQDSISNPFGWQSFCATAMGTTKFIFYTESNFFKIFDWFAYHNILGLGVAHKVANFSSEIYGMPERQVIKLKTYMDHQFWLLVLKVAHEKEERIQEWFFKIQCICRLPVTNAVENEGPNFGQTNSKLHFYLYHVQEQIKVTKCIRKMRTLLLFESSINEMVLTL